MDAACGSVRQGVRDPGAVADDVEGGIAGLQMFIDRDFHVVKFNFDAVKERVVVGGSGRDFVKRIDHFNDAVENALRKDQREVSGCGF